MKKPRRKKADPAQVSGILAAVGRDLGLEKKARELALFQLWEQQVPEGFAGKTRAWGVRQEGRRVILQVRVAEGGLASTLTFHLEELRRQLNRFTPQTGITLDRIELSVGPVT